MNEISVWLAIGAFTLERLTALAFLLVLAGAVVWSLALMRRPQMQPLCSLSLALAIAVFVPPVALFSMTGPVSEASPMAHRLGVALAAVVSAFFLFASLTVAIVGLFLYQRSRGAYWQGRSQAITAIVLSGLQTVSVIVLLVAGFVRAITQSNRSAVAAEGGQLLVYSNLNFEIRHPGDPWVTVPDASYINPAATLLLRSPRGDLSFCVIAENSPQLHAVTTSSLVTFGRQHLRDSFATVTNLTSPESVTIDGVPFLTWRSAARANATGPRLIYQHWVHAGRGYSYQLIACGTPGRFDSAAEQIERTVHSFRRLDPNATVPLGRPLTAGRLAACGVSNITLETDWSDWPDVYDNFPGSAFGARHLSGAYFAYVDIPLDDTSIDVQTAASCLINGLTRFKYPSDSMTARPATVPGARDVLDVRSAANAPTDGIRFRCRVARTDSRLILACAWTEQTTPEGLRVLDEVIEALRILPDPVPPLDPPPPNQRARQAEVLNSLGIALLKEQNVRRATPLWQQAAALCQTNPVYLDNAAYGIEAVDGPAAALAYLTNNVASFPASTSVSARLARLEASTGAVSNSLDRFSAVFREGHRDVDDLVVYANLLIGEQRAAEATRVVDAFAEKDPTPRVRRIQASVRAANGALDDALQRLEQLLTNGPLDPATAYQLGETANDSGRHKRAEEVAALLRAAGHNTPRTALLAGWSHFGRKNWQQAKAEFEIARQLAPDDPNVSHALARAMALLGQGDQSAVRDPLPALPLPPDIARRLAARTNAPALPRDSGVTGLSHTTVLQFSPGQPTISTVRKCLLIQTPEGAAGFDALTLPVDPLSERLYLNDLTIRDESGRLITSGQRPEQYLVDESADSAQGTHRKVLRVVLPTLKAGYVVEWTVTRHDTSATNTPPFTTFGAAYGYPVLQDALVLMGTPAPWRLHSNAVFTADAEVVHTTNFTAWLLHNRRPVQAEPQLAPFDAFLPRLTLADRRLTWEQVGKDYLNNIQDRLQPDTNLVALTRRLTRDCTTPLERLRALALHVQQEITYQAIEFGRRASVPNPPGQVIANRYGDCKDKAVLLWSLLRAADIRAHLALVNANHDIVADVPSLDAFNHMIVHTPGMAPEFIDVTDVHGSGAFLPPAYFQHQALVLDPEQPRLVRTPPCPGRDSIRVALDRSIKTAGTGLLAVQDTATFHGYWAARVRAFLGDIPADERTAAVQRWLGEGGVQISRVTMTHMDEPSKPLLMGLTYTVPVRNTRTELVLPRPLESSLLGLTYVAERRHPFHLNLPLILTSRVDVTSVPAPDPSQFAALGKSGQDRFVTWSTMVENGNRPESMLLTFSCEARDGIYPAGDYSPCFEAREAALNALGGPVRFLSASPASPSASP